MPRISEKPLSRIHVLIWREDYQQLKEMFDGTETSVSEAIRSIVHSYVTNVRERAEQEINELDLDLDEVIPLKEHL